MLVGSLRKGSLTRRITKALIALAPPWNRECMAFRPDISTCAIGVVASRTCDNHRERHRSESKNLATGLMLNETSAPDDDAARTTCGRCQCAALSSVGLASGARTNSASAAT
jgi:hypothetical protein